MYIFTEKGEKRAREIGVEERKAGTVAMFAGKVLTYRPLAKAWMEKGYIKEAPTSPLNQGTCMNFRNIKPEYSRYKILAEKNGFILAKIADTKNLYVFGTEDNFNISSFPENQRGTLAEILEELKRRQHEVDCNNTLMLEVETEFIKTLSEEVDK